MHGAFRGSSPVSCECACMQQSGLRYRPVQPAERGGSACPRARTCTSRCLRVSTSFACSARLSAMCRWRLCSRECTAASSDARPFSTKRTWRSSACMPLSSSAHSRSITCARLDSCATCAVSESRVARSASTWPSACVPQSRELASSPCSECIVASCAARSACDASRTCACSTRSWQSSRASPLRVSQRRAQSSASRSRLLSCAMMHW